MDLSHFEGQIKKLVFRLWNIFKTDTLFRNSIYLMLGTAVLAGFGFFFWIINARIFTSAEVGIGTTLISAASLISGFSLLGLGNSIIKYLPNAGKKNDNINTTFTIVAVTSFILSVGFLTFLKTFSPSLFFIRENYLFIFLFMLFVVFTSLNSVLESVFIGYRSSAYVLIKNTIFSVAKIILPFLLISFGVFGIFTAYGIALSIASIISLGFLSWKFGFVINPKINIEIVRKMMKFSLGSYLAGFIGGFPALVLPIIITNSIGAKFSAYYYIDMMIANFLYVIPIAVSQSLFAEGSHNEKELKDHLKKAFKIITLILVPAIIMALFFGKYILLAFGKEYSVEGVIFLQILAVSGIFVAVNYVGNALLYIKHRIRLLFFINIVSTVLILGGSYLWANHNLVGIGYAWLAGSVVTSFIYLFLLYFDKSITSPISSSVLGES